MSTRHLPNHAVSVEEIDRQRHYIKKIQFLNQKDFEKTGIQKTMYINTYGCQMNVHDSEKIEGMLSQMGYYLTTDEMAADMIIYNTCCIRENAENKMYGNLGFFKPVKLKNKKLKIILCGCMMQQDTVLEKIRKSYNFVDIIFGTYNLYKLPELLYANIESSSQIIDIWQEQKESIEDLPSVRQYKFKAGVNIMYGCNNYCTYCIVPYVRGRERSREPESIIAEIKELVADSVVEILLLGQNVNSYGTGLNDGIDFAKLLRMIAGVKGLRRIRFMTSHPKDLSDDLIQVIKECDNVCKGIHLPFQSGSTRILTKMNRRYTKESYLLLTQKLRDEIPGIALTTDIITGFPSETDFDNDETIDIIKKVRFSQAYTYLYSKRGGTPAANMDEQVDEATAKVRFNKLLTVLKPISLDINKARIGNTYEILVEDISKNDDALLSGRTDDFSLVHFKGDKSLIGTFVNVKIISCKTFYLVGEKI